MFLNVSYHTQKPYHHWFFSNTNVTVVVPNLLLAESVLSMDHLAIGYGRRPLVFPEPEPVLSMTHLISKICPLAETAHDFCMRTGATVKACLLATKYFYRFLRVELMILVFQGQCILF